MQNGAVIVFLAIAAMGAVAAYGYINRNTVKLCDVPAFKVTKAEGAKVIQNGAASEPKAVKVPCDELEQTN